MNEYDIAADMIRKHYATDTNGHQGTIVHVRFESLREEIAAAILQIDELRKELKEATCHGQHMTCGACENIRLSGSIGTKS